MQKKITRDVRDSGTLSENPTPRFLQGVFPFAGKGLFEPNPIDDSLRYEVPNRCMAQVIYLRAGNHSDDLIYLLLCASGVPIRYFPAGPKSDLHIPLAIVENHPAGTHLELLLAAPRGLSGTVIIDCGLLETPVTDETGENT